MSSDLSLLGNAITPSCSSVKIHFFFLPWQADTIFEKQALPYIFHLSPHFPSGVLSFFLVPCHDVPVSLRLSSLNIGVLFVPDALESLR
jgi:hypothetical protein